MTRWQGVLFDLDGTLLDTALDLGGALNDLLAETIGSALGVAAWLAWGNAARRMTLTLGRGGTAALRAAAIVYVLGYIALGLFPFDFLISIDEFHAKLARGVTGWLDRKSTRLNSSH